jgi:hypothetical protein
MNSSADNANASRSAAVLYASARGCGGGSGGSALLWGAAPSAPAAASCAGPGAALLPMPASDCASGWPCRAAMRLLRLRSGAPVSCPAFAAPVAAPLAGGCTACEQQPPAADCPACSAACCTQSGAACASGPAATMCMRLLAAGIGAATGDRRCMLLAA